MMNSLRPIPNPNLNKYSTKFFSIILKIINIHILLFKEKKTFFYLNYVN